MTNRVQPFPSRNESAQKKDLFPRNIKVAPEPISFAQPVLSKGTAGLDDD